MSEFLRPQTPLKNRKGEYIYPITTANQVIMEDGSRLNSAFKHTSRENAILLASEWSGQLPFTQTIPLVGNFDNVKFDINILYSGENISDIALHKAVSCVSYSQKTSEGITFYCLEEAPLIDIPIEIVGVSSTSIASVITGSGSGIDTTDATAISADILQGKTAYANNQKLYGTIPFKSPSDLTVSGPTISVPAGYYNSQATKSVATTEQAEPVISVSSTGEIIASVEQDEGYVSAGTKTATHQLTTVGSSTITPGTVAKTAAPSNVYTTGAITVKGDVDLVPDNIRKGVNIFDVTGTWDNLNFKVVGGTSAPTSPEYNTIWVNTDIAIGNWVFSPNQPSSPSHGDVWIITSTDSGVSFNAVKDGVLENHPIYCKQYISSGSTVSAWELKEALIWQGEWIEWYKFLYDHGNECKNITGGWIRSLSSGGTATKTADRIEFRYNDEGGNGSAMRTGKIDLTNISTIYIKMENTQFTNNGNFIIGAYTSVPNTYDILLNKWAARRFINTTGVLNATIDVSTLSGSYYIACICRASFQDGVNSRANADLIEMKMR